MYAHHHVQPFFCAPIFSSSAFNCTEKSSVVSSSSQLSSQRCVFAVCAPTSSSLAQSRHLNQQLGFLNTFSIAYLLQGSLRTHRPPRAARQASVLVVVGSCPCCLSQLLRCLLSFVLGSPCSMILQTRGLWRCSGVDRSRIDIDDAA
jgi:hypothetical protein